jgi:molybdopterin-binding protein
MKVPGHLLVRDLSVQLDDFTLSDLNLEVNKGEYFVLLGPTGSGKTVLLEAIAGIIPPRSGSIHLDGKDISGSPPELRRVGFVYQNYALFPHLTVEENISFGLVNRGQIDGPADSESHYTNRLFPGLRQIFRGRLRKNTAIRNRVQEISSLLQVSNLLDRKPGTLSGGEKQRVAMARALITNPRVLLLDEPLSALDPETRELIQYELRRIHQQLGTTTLHITHDFEVAVALADRIGVIIDGNIIQIGTPREIFRQPINEQVARFVGVRNIFRGQHIIGQDGSGFLQLDGFEFASISKLEGNVRASIRPEDILLSLQPLKSSARNNFQGKVKNISDRGPFSYITVQLPSPKKNGKTLDLVVLITQSSTEQLSLVPEMEVHLAFKASGLHIF